jgi:hypothetical protein
MSINGQNAAAIEIDMRDVLRAKKVKHSDPVKEPATDYASLVTQMSVRSVHDIDHLIEGLQGVREKLNSDGDQLHRDIVQHAAFSQEIIQLAEIVSDGLASLNKAVLVSKDVA